MAALIPDEKNIVFNLHKNIFKYLETSQAIIGDQKPHLQLMEPNCTNMVQSILKILDNKKTSVVIPSLSFCQEHHPAAQLVATWSKQTEFELYDVGLAKTLAGQASLIIKLLLQLVPDWDL